MKHYTLLKSTAMALIFLVVLAGCQYFGLEKPKGKNIVCVVDFSESSNRAERLHFYQEVIEKNIIPALGEYDKLMIIPLDKESLTNSSDILVADFSTHNFRPEIASPMEEDAILQATLKKARDSVAVVFVTNFKQAINDRTTGKQATDIFGALDIAKGRLNNHDKNYLIMLSDMMNWSSSIKMEPANKAFTTGNNAAGLAENAPQCDLQKCMALVVTGKQVDASSEHFRKVQEFWQAYFKKNNATLHDYSSVSLVKLRELMAEKI